MSSETAAPVGAPRIRVRPEDFVVVEVPLYPASGEGAHTFLQIEKRLRTTEQVARDLARAAQVRPRDVGYAGRKDRVAVTTQWFSVPDLDPESAPRLSLPGARVLEAVRHPHKLRTGHLRGNRFEIRVRGVSPEVAQRAHDSASEIACRGFANRYGSQRFGHAGRNPELGREILCGERSGRQRVDRRKARFLVSALQSAVFDEALRRRSLPLDHVEVGDVAVVNASGGLFPVEDLEREAPRAARFEISATGPIFGTRCPSPAGTVLERELAALAVFGLPDPTKIRPPPGIRLRGARRALRCRPEGLAFEEADGDLQVHFELPPGSYATVFLEAWLGPVGSGPDDTASSPGLC